MGEEVIYHITSRQSYGEKTLMEVSISPKGGNPLHYHKRFSEKFTVIEGMLNVQVGNTIHKLEKGGTATASINVRHRFFNTSGNTTRFYCELSPASEGFEKCVENSFWFGAGWANSEEWIA